MAELSHWGWGRADAHPGMEELRAAAAGFVEHLGFGSTEPEEPVALEDVRLPAPRVEIPPALAPFSSASRFDRTFCAHGRSYTDVVRGFRGEFRWPPDFVARPRDERELSSVLEWCAGAGVACTPRGGGTSVVGGVDPRPGGSARNGAIVLALDAFDRVEEVDRASLAARIGAGANGPRLEEQLAASGLTLRFYPQSFELATLGGWIVTRAGGHFASGPTHIDDVVESVRAITPTGEWESRRLPASGAGPSPDRMLLGSEGTLGVVTSAWVRVLPRPTERRSASVRFPGGFAAGADAVRAILQDGLRPSNCRLIDPGEARLTFAGDGSHALLVLGFESHGRPLDSDFERALAFCREAGGDWDEPRAGSGGGGSAAWREAFLRAPYLRDTFIAIGVLSETFETAITWERLPAFCETVVGEVEALAGRGRCTVRLTHAYPDGAAPYFTVVAPAERGEEVAQWAALKQAAGEVVHRAGGTITHHHAVGRDHRPWYDRQRPDAFARALSAAKAEVDPAGILNPGVLLG